MKPLPEVRIDENLRTVKSLLLVLILRCEENGLYEEAEREYKDLADFHAKMGELAEQGKYWR